MERIRARSSELRRRPRRSALPAERLARSAPRGAHLHSPGAADQRERRSRRGRGYANEGGVAVGVPTRGVFALPRLAAAAPPNGARESAGWGGGEGTNGVICFFPFSYIFFSGAKNIIRKFFSGMRCFKLRFSAQGPLCLLGKKNSDNNNKKKNRKKERKKEKQNKQSPKRRGSEQRIAYPDGLLGNAAGSGAVPPGCRWGCDGQQVAVGTREAVGGCWDAGGSAPCPRGADAAVRPCCVLSSSRGANYVRAEVSNSGAAPQNGHRVVPPLAA